MTTHVDALLREGALTFAFQPIVHVTAHKRTVFSFEGLTRGPIGTNFARPDVLFAYMRRKRCEQQIDTFCMLMILREAAALPPWASISINVHAATLARNTRFADQLVAAAEEGGIWLNRIVLEILEHGAAWYTPHFLEAITRLRALSIRLALDDVGICLSNYKMILDTLPDLFKIDRYLVGGCSQDRDRRIVLSSIQRLAADFGGRTVAEGVERHDDAETLLDLGIDLLQGYLFSKPLTAVSFAHMDGPTYLARDRFPHLADDVACR